MSDPVLGDLSRPTSASGSRRPDRVTARRASPHALFNWAFARHHGGTFVFRIEDTDAARNSRGSYDTLLDVDALARLRLGRGPRGRRPDYGPYRQCERMRDLRRRRCARLRDETAAPTTATAPTRRSRRAARRAAPRTRGTTASAAS